MDGAALLLNALVYGVLLSLLLAAVIGLSFAVAPDMWVGDYPPDIRQAYGPVSGKGRRFRPLFGLLFFGTAIAVVALSFAALRDAAPAELTFADLFLTGFIVLMVFNAFDLLIVDWLVFVNIQPQPIILPGTEGMAGYKDYAFHFRGFVVGIVISAIGAAVMSAIAYVLLASFS